MNKRPMKILFLCKRRPLARDLWERPYGRFFNLPVEMAKMGHQVDLILLNYKNESGFVEARNGITWHSVNLLPDPFYYYRYVKKLALKQEVDWLVGFSDTYYGICAQMIAEKINAKSAIDAYDNYESYMSWNKPLHWLWRRALNKCDLITAAGPGLLHKMLLNSGRSDGVKCGTIPMSADKEFSVGDKFKARKLLNLPSEFFLVGYSGSLFKNRNINLLIEAINILSERIPNVRFVLTGRLQSNIEMPKNVYWLGYIADNLMVNIYRSLDLLISVNADSEFGNYSYPVKIYEALSCGIPVLATNTESTKFVLQQYPQALFQSGSSAEIVSAVERFYVSQYKPEAIIAGWKERANIFESLLINRV